MPRIASSRQVGAIVASARKARGLTQAELAQLAGVSRQLVNRLESGAASGIALSKLLRILDAAGCALDVRSLYDGASAAPHNARAAPFSLTPEDLGAEYVLDETLFEPVGGGALVAWRQSIQVCPAVQGRHMVRVPWGGGHDAHPEARHRGHEARGAG